MRLALVVLWGAALAGAADNIQMSGPLQLSLKRAVDMAIAPEGSAKVQLATEARKQAQVRAAEARAALLPDLSAAVNVENLTRNLQAFGLRLSSPIPGVQIPAFVGPFTTVDARFSGTQTIFDLASIRRYQASKVGISAAKSDVENTEEQVAAQVARAYLAVVKADADVESAKANIALSEAV